MECKECGEEDDRFVYCKGCKAEIYVPPPPLSKITFRLAVNKFAFGCGTSVSPERPRGRLMIGDDISVTASLPISVLATAPE